MCYEEIEVIPHVAWAEILGGILLMVLAPVVAHRRIRRGRDAHPTYRAAQIVAVCGQEILALLWIAVNVSELADRLTIDAGTRATLFLLIFLPTMFVAATLEGYSMRAAIGRGERVE
jgi:hypothetical protein